MTETATGFTLELAEPAYGVAPGQIAVLYDDDAVIGCGVVSSATRIRMLVQLLAATAGEIADYASPSSCSPRVSPSRTHSCAWAEPSRAFR